jgi:DNA-binding CsgD family transcriptional regulator
VPAPNPVNFESGELDAMLADWLASLRQRAVAAVVVLGPDPFGSVEDREVLAAHPPTVAAAAHALARSPEFGAQWRESDAPLVAWQSLARGEARPVDAWRAHCAALGLQALVRVAFPLPAGRAFECFLFCARELPGREHAAALAWSAMSAWPALRRGVAAARSLLSPRERECLEFAFEGLTARETAARLQCAERTVNYHLANAMGKLRVDSKLAAIQRACWLGLI